MNLAKIFSVVQSLVLDALFPIQCLGCRESTKQFLCSACLETIPLLAEQRCPLCTDHITPFGRVCVSCPQASPLDGILAAASYKNKILARTIHAYKYRFIETLRAPLSLLLIKTIRIAEIPLPDCIIPVPLHSLRLRFRGFNQSEHLANDIASSLAPHFSIPVIADHLKRIRFTTPQMSISDAAWRNENVKDAFAWKPPEHQAVDIQGKYIWLLDDIATTGSTLTECARILKKAGAKEVFGIVIAR